MIRQYARHVFIKQRDCIGSFGQTLFVQSDWHTWLPVIQNIGKHILIDITARGDNGNFTAGKS